MTGRPGCYIKTKTGVTWTALEPYERAIELLRHCKDPGDLIELTDADSPGKRFAISRGSIETIRDGGY